MMPWEIPLPNLITNELYATGNTESLLLYDSTLFDNMHLPNGIELGEIVDWILLKHGLATLMHPDPRYMKIAIEKWSAVKVRNWEKLLATTQLEYNPIHNYDRTETITENIEDSRKTDQSTSSSSNGSTSQTESPDTTTTHLVSAENESDYSPESKDEQTGNVRTESETNLDNDTDTHGTDEYNRKFTHSNKTEGNIGVTTTQQMIQSERDIVRYNIIEEIASDYYDTFCLSIY